MSYIFDEGGRSRLEGAGGVGSMVSTVLPHSATASQSYKSAVILFKRRCYRCLGGPADRYLTKMSTLHRFSAE